MWTSGTHEREALKRSYQRWLKLCETKIEVLLEVLETAKCG